MLRSIDRDAVVSCRKSDNLDHDRTPAPLPTRAKRRVSGIIGRFAPLFLICGGVLVAEEIHLGHASRMQSTFIEHDSVR